MEASTFWTGLFLNLHNDFFGLDIFTKVNYKIVTTYYDYSVYISAKYSMTRNLKKIIQKVIIGFNWIKQQLK